MDLSLKRLALRNWLLALKGSYLESNSYHNQLHGADVCQTMYCLMMNSPFGDQLTDKMKYVSLLAAAAHDVGHIGLNNNFLVNTNDPLAIMYCYEAPLEKMHAAKGFELMRLPDADVFHIFDGEELKNARHWFMSLILSTDMADHFHHISQLTKKLDTVGLEFKDNNADTQLICGMLLHAADVSNPTKSWKYYGLWTERVMEEFWAQGDKERELNLHVSDGYDRKKPTPQAKFQSGFIAFIVKPLFECLQRIDTLHLEPFLAGLEDNSSQWKRQSNMSAPTSERKKSVMKRNSVLKREAGGMLGSPGRDLKESAMIAVMEEAQEEEEKQ